MSNISLSNIVKDFDKEVKETLLADKKIPHICIGDTISLQVKIGPERTQKYEGLCISIKNNGLHTSFTVRKISYGEGVERTFPLYSNNITEITVVKRGKVRRSKLYYIRNLRGKAARIAEDITGYKAKLAKN